MPHSDHADPRQPGITSIELFFDLVFVFAVSQLSHHLLEHTDWRGAVETLVMLVAVFSVWSYTSFEVTLTHARHTRVASMMFVVMLLGLFMNAAITEAFAEHPLAFVVPLLAIQIGRTLLSTIPAAPTPILRRHYTIMLGWILASAPMWVAGAFAAPEARLGWWGAAALFDTVGTWLAHPIPGRKLRSESMPFDAEHMIERLRLFLIIALGEVVLATGAAIAKAPPELTTWLAGACALAIVIALWSLYFRSSDHLVSRHADETSDPILAARLAMNGQFVVVGALIAIAVANEKVIAHAHGHADAAIVTLMFGGLAAYLVVQVWYLRLVTGHVALMRALAVAAILIVATSIGLAHAAPIVIIAMAAAMMTALAIAVAHGQRNSAIPTS